MVIILLYILPYVFLIFINSWKSGLSVKRKVNMSSMFMWNTSSTTWIRKCSCPSHVDDRTGKE